MWGRRANGLLGSVPGLSGNDGPGSLTLSPTADTAIATPPISGPGSGVILTASAASAGDAEPSAGSGEEASIGAAVGPASVGFSSRPLSEEGNGAESERRSPNLCRRMSAAAAPTLPFHPPTLPFQRKPDCSNVSRLAADVLLESLMKTSHSLRSTSASGSDPPDSGCCPPKSAL